MAYALVHYPAIDTEQINELRHKYDPQVDLIAPHVTLVFPVPASIGEAILVAHIGNVLRNWRQFPLHLQGLEQSWDNCLFLRLQAGNTESFVYTMSYTQGCWRPTLDRTFRTCRMSRSVRLLTLSSFAHKL
jgi:hypothetical protein